MKEHTMTEGIKRTELRALTIEELSLVSGGARTNGDNPFVKQVMEA